MSRKQYITPAIKTVDSGDIVTAIGPAQGYGGGGGGGGKVHDHGGWCPWWGWWC